MQLPCRILSLVQACSLALLVLLASTVPGVAVAAERIRGDLTTDGRVDVSDMTLLFDWLSREDQSTVCPMVADVNGDSVMDYSDAVYLSLFLFSHGDDPVPLPAVQDPCVNPLPDFPLRNVVALGLTPASAMVTWETPLRSSTTVRFGLAADALNDVVEVNEKSFYHQAALRSLTPSTKYFVQVESRTPEGQLVRSEIQTVVTPDDPVLPVRAEHPRVLLNPSRLQEVKRSVGPGGGKQKLWAELLAWCDSRLDSSVETLASGDDVDLKVRAFAFAGLISGQAKYKNKAVQIAIYVAERGAGEELRASIEALAYVYDWLHDQIPLGTSKQVLTRLMRLLRDLDAQNREDEFVTGHSHGNHKSILIGALAAYGEHPAAQPLLESAVRNYRHGFLATWRRFGGVDGGSSKGWWYTSYALPFELEFFDAWRSATGEDLFLTERTWCEGLVDWFVYGLRGDNTFIREGDNKVFNGLNSQDRQFALLAAREYGNSTAQWLARRVSQVTPVWGPHAVLDILWTDVDVETAPPSGSGVKHFRNAGVVVMRESWKRDAVLATFRSAEAYTMGHSHRDNCSFTLFYKTGLAIDSGVYDDFSSKHHRNYYTRSIAHNTITVFDPKEQFQIYGETYANDGGQRWLLEGIDVVNYWPATAEETIERTAGYRLGGITRHEDAEEFTYSVGSGTASYSRSKLKRFLRHFLWLKKVNGWEKPVMLVFDDVIAAKADLKKAYLLHTVGEPNIKDGLISARNGEGKLFHATLAPADAVLTPVGGPGKEFLVDGINYPPIRVPRENEEAGAWRVEISPGESRLADRFVHALYPALAEDGAPAPAASFEVGDMQLCELAQWTVLFDANGLPDNFEYPNRREETSHLVFGAVPHATYHVAVDGNVVSSVQASFSGSLRYDVEALGTVRLTRVLP